MTVIDFPGRFPELCGARAKDKNLLTVETQIDTGRVARSFERLARLMQAYATSGPADRWAVRACSEFAACNARLARDLRHAGKAA